MEKHEIPTVASLSEADLQTLIAGFSRIANDPTIGATERKAAAAFVSRLKLERLGRVEIVDISGKQHQH